MLFTRTRRTQLGVSSGLGNNGERERRCPVQEMNDGEPPCSSIDSMQAMTIFFVSAEVQAKEYLCCILVRC